MRCTRGLDRRDAVRRFEDAPQANHGGGALLVGLQDRVTAGRSAYSLPSKLDTDPRTNAATDLSYCLYTAV